MITTEQRLFTIFDETAGLSTFAGEVLESAHTLIVDPELKLIVRRDLAAVRIFSAKIDARMVSLQVKSPEQVLTRRGEPAEATYLPLVDLRSDLWLAAWCAGSETALQHCLDIAVANQLPVDVEKAFRRQLVRILRRRARIESWIAKQPPPPTAAAATASPPVEPHVLLVRLSSTQGAVMQREFLLRNIPCVTANGAGEAMFRVVRRRPLMVLVNPSQVSDTRAIADELESNEQHVPVISIHDGTSNESLVKSVDDATRAISETSEHVARDRAKKS